MEVIYSLEPAISTKVGGMRKRLEGSCNSGLDPGDKGPTCGLKEEWKGRKVGHLEGSAGQVLVLSEDAAEARESHPPVG